MNEQTYEAWWKLHLRNAKGEALTPSEQAVYELGCKEIDGQEDQSESLKNLLNARSRTSELQKEYLNLKQEYEGAEAEIAQLQSQLSPSTRELLGVASI